MKYKNTSVPKVLRKQFEDAVNGLVDHPKLKLITKCEYNSDDHIRIGCLLYVKDAVDGLLVSDVALADRGLMDMLQEKGGFDTFYRHILDWLVPALKNKWRKNNG